MWISFADRCNSDFSTKDLVEKTIQLKTHHFWIGNTPNKARQPTMLSRTSTASKPLVRQTLARSLATQAGGSNNGSSNAKKKDWKLEAAVAAALSAVTATSVTLMERAQQQRQQPHYLQPEAMVPSSKETPTTLKGKPRMNQPPPRLDLPVYSREEVEQHCDEDSLWYTFRGELRIEESVVMWCGR